MGNFLSGTLFPLNPLVINEIWSSADHSAFTDLCIFQKRLYCTFRESDTHQKGRAGVIRVIASQFDDQWRSIALIKKRGWDLRDPKLSITPQGTLLLLFSAVKRDRKKKYQTRQSYFIESVDGEHFGDWHPILSEHEWLWRLTWHEGIAYGVSYRCSSLQDIKEEWLTSLYRFDFSQNPHQPMTEKIADWQIPGYPNETTLRFLKDGTMVALVRRDLPQDRAAWIGYAKAPYATWIWQPAPFYLGGPNFIVLPDERMIAAGRVIYLSPYCVICRTCLASMDLEFGLKCEQILPSDGDTGYPGMVYQAPYLWISYYSSHKTKSSIYLAKFKIDKDL